MEYFKKGFVHYLKLIEAMQLERIIRPSTMLRILLLVSVATCMDEDSARARDSAEQTFFFMEGSLV